MSINKVDAFSVAYPESNDDNHTRYLTFCRIETKDGVTGWGEAIPMSGTGFPEACRATEQIIKGVEDLLLGRDPLDNMEIHNDLQKRMWWYGPEGIASFALSAIDIAIWDLKGKLLSTPIINPPQSAILGMHNIVERPIAVNGKVEIRPVMYLALSYDHRIIDGKESVGFLVTIKEALENPAEILMHNKILQSLNLK